MIKQSAQKDTKQLKLSSISGRQQNGATILDKSLIVFYEVKHTLTIWPSNLTLSYLLKTEENICPYDYLYASSYNSFTHYIPRLKIIQMSINWWMDELTLNIHYLYSFLSCLFDCGLFDIFMVVMLPIRN